MINVPLPRETDPTHVSIFQVLLYLQFADFGLHFELLTGLVDILEDVHVFAFGVLEVQPLNH